MVYRIIEFLRQRDDARALSKYRIEGATPADIRRMVGL
jgi:glutamyl-Q tRNA(Asp) synthetase